MLDAIPRDVQQCFAKTEFEDDVCMVTMRVHPDIAPGTPDLSGMTVSNATFRRINPAFRPRCEFPTCFA